MAKLVKNVIRVRASSSIFKWNVTDQVKDWTWVIALENGSDDSNASMVF